jgi:hypothetical protein
MQTFLTNAILFIAIAFACLMILDFILGLLHLAHSAEPTISTLPQTQPEDVFKIIDKSEKTVPTETEAEKLVPSTPDLTDIPSPQFTPQFSTVGSASIDYEAMTIRELKGLASSLKIPYYCRKRKAELIEAICRC